MTKQKAQQISVSRIIHEKNISSNDIRKPQKKRQVNEKRMTNRTGLREL